MSCITLAGWAKWGGNDCRAVLQDLRCRTIDLRRIRSSWCARVWREQKNGLRESDDHYELMEVKWKKMPSRKNMQINRMLFRSIIMKHVNATAPPSFTSSHFSLLLLCSLVITHAIMVDVIVVRCVAIKLLQTPVNIPAHTRSDSTLASTHSHTRSKPVQQNN